MFEIIDTHAHLDFEAFKDDLSQVLERASNAGIGRIISIGAGRGMDGNYAALALSQKYNHIFATVGVHPHDAKIIDQTVLSEIARLAQADKVVAIGETGLDFFKEYSPKETQIKRFRDQLALAKSVDLPAVIHDREAHEELMRILKSDGAGEAGGVMHCFSGDAGLAQEFIGMGFYISIPGVVTFKNSRKIREVVSQVPLSRLLVETDCPYLTPEPHRGKRNEPAYVRLTAEAVAGIRGIGLEEVARQTTANAERIFRLK